MASQADLDQMYMEMAFSASKLSHARRRKVGAILVVPGGGRYEGINGMPSGFDNNCEDEVHCDHEFVEFPPVEKVCTKCLWTESKPNNLVTKPECLHAEANAIIKIACSTDKSIGATIYCTLSPCADCAKLIIQAKIVRVVYADEHTFDGTAKPGGVALLERAGIQVDTLTLE